MGLLSAFSQNPAFQQQLSGIMSQTSPGFTAPQRMPPPVSAPPVMNPGGGIGGGLNPSQVRNPMGDMDRWQYGGLSGFGGDYAAAMQRSPLLPMILPNMRW